MNKFKLILKTLAVIIIPGAIPLALFYYIYRRFKK